MKIAVVDDTKSRTSQISEALEKAKHKVILCASSNDFMSTIDEHAVQCLCLDYDTWHNGRAIYGYFKLHKKIENMPVVFYNAPAHFSTLPNRAKHERDQFLPSPMDPKAIVDAVTLCM